MLVSYSTDGLMFASALASFAPLHRSPYFARRTLSMGELVPRVHLEMDRLKHCRSQEIQQISADYLDNALCHSSTVKRSNKNTSPPSVLGKSATQTPNQIDFAVLAIVAEAVHRSIGYRMYDCQLYAAAMAASGRMIEMQTGEGKTLVCGAAAAIAALSGRPTHVATTNAYLAGRDYESVKPLFDFLGLSSQSLPEKYSPEESRVAYEKQIVYGPGYQFGFDYLADQMSLQKSQHDRLGAATLCLLHGTDPDQNRVQCCEFNTTIVDEADSVLIDEALTPLILSANTNKPSDPSAFQAANQLASKLIDTVDYKLDRSRSHLILTESGQQTSEEYRKGLSNIKLQRTWTSYVTNALRANLLMHRNVDYVVVDGKVKIVDPLTGRIFEDRSWQAGLHQAIEIKEGLALTPPRETQVRITRQAFIAKYQTLCGMSGTISDNAAELRHTYGVTVVTVPTNKPSKRIAMPNRFFSSWETKSQAIASDVLQRHAKGQPILIGTASIHKSLQISEALQAIGLRGVVLNGLQDRSEAEIVELAGQVGQITIATNMAGRGTDIKLTAESKQRGGLHVIGTEPNSCRRVDRQLVGRAARQGDPGSSQFYISADDELIAKKNPRLARQIALSCGSKSESRVDFSSAIQQLQMQEERLQEEARSRMVNHERWLQQARQTVFGR